MSIVPDPFLRFARLSLASGFSSREKDSENDASQEPAAAAAAETEAAPVWLPIIERCASHDRCSKSFWAESSEEIQIHLTLAGFDEAKNKIYEVLWGQALKAERGVQFTPRELELLKTRVTPASLKYLNSVGVERDDYDEAERVFRIVDQRTRTSWCRLRAGLYPEEVSKQREKKKAAAAAAADTKAAAAGAADLAALSPPQDENGDDEVASEEVEPRGALAEIRKLLRAGASRDPEVRLASLFSLYGPPIFLPVSCVCCRAAPRPLTPPPSLLLSLISLSGLLPGDSGDMGSGREQGMPPERARARPGQLHRRGVEENGRQKASWRRQRDAYARSDVSRYQVLLRRHEQQREVPPQGGEDD